MPKKLSPVTKIIIGAVAAVGVAAGIIFGVVLPNSSNSDGNAVQTAGLTPFEQALLDEGTAAVEINEDIVLENLVYVTGDKTLTGSGKISLANGADYIIVVNEGASLTLDGPTISGEGTTANGVYVSANADFDLKSGAIEKLSGHAVRVLGSAEISGGAVRETGTNWVMVDENASLKLSGGEFAGAGDNGIITGLGSKITVDKAVSFSEAAGSIIYNMGTAEIKGTTFSGADSYAIHNEGKMSIKDAEFTGAEILGYIENAANAELTLTGGKMEDSRADFIYNQGTAVIKKVEFNKSTGSAIESKGSNASLEIKDCTFEQIGRNVVTNRLSPLTMENVKIGDCGGYIVQNRGAEFHGKNITAGNVGATAYINDSGTDSEAVGCKDFTLDKFSFTSSKEYGFRNNGGTMTLTNGSVGKTDDYSLYIRDGEVITDKVTFEGTNGEGRSVVQIGTSSKPLGKLTATDCVFSGGARGVTNHGTFIFNSGKITNNKTSGDVTYGGGINNTGTCELNGGEITFNSASNGGGGIYNAGEMNINKKVIIKYNSCGTNGAGISNKGTLTIKDAMIFGNAACNNAGGINNIGSLSFLGGAVLENRAVKNAGGVYNSGSAQFYGGSINKNTSVDNGAGIYVTSTGSALLDGVTVNGNIAGTAEVSSNAGGLYNLGTTTIRGKTSIQDNEATNNGSGVYNTSKATLKINGGKITGSPENGYAVYCYRGDSGDGKTLVSGSPEIESIYKSLNASLVLDGTLKKEINIYLSKYRVGMEAISESKAGLIAENKSNIVLPELPEGKILGDDGKIAMAPGAKVVAEYNSIQYTSIEEAYYDIVEDGMTGEIKLIDDVALSGSLEFSAGTDITLDLNSHSITQTKTNERVFMVKGTLSVKGNGTITGGEISTNGAAIYVSSANLNIYDGVVISGCAAGEKAGGVYITKATGSDTPSVVNMYGGTITACTSGGSGSAVYVAGGSTFNMSGGAISECAEKAVFVYNGTFNFTGGKLTIKNGISRNADNGKVSIAGGWVATKPINAYVAEGYVVTDVVADAPDSAAPYTTLPADFEYTVNYVTNNTTSIQSASGTVEKLVELPLPTAEGDFDFAGWYLNSSFTGNAYLDGDTPYFCSSDVTLYAKWAELPDVATVKIGDGEAVGYKSFVKALAATEGKTSTLKLLENTTLDSIITVADGTTLTLDLNGFNLTQKASDRVFMVKGTLNIRGSGTVSGGSAKNGGCIYVSSGVCNLYDSVLITGCSASEKAGAVYITKTSGSTVSGTFNMRGGTIKSCTAGGNGSCIYIANAGTASISGGMIDGFAEKGVYAYNGTLNVSGGIFTAKNVVAKASSASLSISGGWFANEITDNLAAGCVGTGACADAPNVQAPYTIVADGFSYKVKFTTNNGTEISELSGTVAMPVELPEPTDLSEDTDFAGWYTDSTFSGKGYAAGTTPFFSAAETMLYAKWEELPDIADVTVSGTTTSYKKLADAFTAADGKTATIALKGNATISAQLSVSASTNITLNMNGYNINQIGSARVFYVKGVLSVNGGSISGGSEQYGGGFNVYGGTLNVSGLTVTNCTASSSGGAFYVTNSGTANIYSANVSNCSGGTSATIFVAKGVANISGGNYYIASSLSRNATNGTISVTGGWFASKVSSNYKASGYVSTNACADAPDSSVPYTVALSGSTYSVAFTSDKGTAPQTLTPERGTTTKLSAPEYEGTDFVFDHWEDEGGKTYDTATDYEFAGSVTLTAVWTPVAPV